MLKRQGVCCQGCSFVFGEKENKTTKQQYNLINPKAVGAKMFAHILAVRLLALGAEGPNSCSECVRLLLDFLLETFPAAWLIQYLPDGSVAGWGDRWLRVCTWGTSIELKVVPQLTGANWEWNCSAPDPSFCSWGREGLCTVTPPSLSPVRL